MAKALTPFAIQHLKAGPARREIPDPGARGLYVVVHPTGRKTYVVRYRFGGRPKKLTLTGGISLAAARRAAGDALYEVEQSRDPSAAKRQRKVTQKVAAANTFKAVAEAYFKRKGGGKGGGGADLRSKKWREAVLDRLVYPTIGDRPMSEIKRSEIIGLLDKIEEGTLKGADGKRIKGGPVMADRTLAVVRKIFHWHALRDDDFKSPIVKGMARTSSKERARERTLTDDEIRAVWKAADAGEGPFPSLVKFLLLTAARRNEAAHMMRNELAGTDWVLPAGRNKTGVDLIRPLTAMALSVLDGVPKLAECEFVFSTDGRSPISGFSQFKKNFDETCGVTGWTLHDLRRTARSLMSRAGVNSDHAERCLGHVIAGVRGTYDRHAYHDEKRLAFEALAAQVVRVLNPTDNVVELRKG